MTFNIGVDFTVYQAISHGHTAALRRYLRYRSRSLYIRDKYGRTLLMLAVSANNEELVQLLIELGSELDAQNVYGWTALHYASLQGQTPVVKTLLKARARPDMRCKLGKTPLQLTMVRETAVAKLLGNQHAAAHAECAQRLRSAENKTRALAHWKRHAPVAGRARLVIKKKLQLKWDEVRFRPWHSGAAAAAESFYAAAARQQAIKA